LTTPFEAGIPGLGNSLVMSLLSIAEVFGYDTADNSPEAQRGRDQKWCRFLKGPCCKTSQKNPLGICSFADGAGAGTVCPRRFVEGDRIFLDVARAAFGAGGRIAIVPEMRILNIPDNPKRKIGKIDYIVAKLGSSDEVCDFAALEVQSVYISGESIRDAFEEFLVSGAVPAGSQRRLDYRSSAQKRLMPQLSLKVPVFRRWGKKFFVAVDSRFFENLPLTRTVASLANSEITWLVYPFQKSGPRYCIGEPRFIYTKWDDVLTDLREGEEPTPEELMQEIALKTKRQKTRVRILNA
jgi:hypothetical protein